MALSTRDLEEDALGGGVALAALGGRQHFHHPGERVRFDQLERCAAKVAIDSASLTSISPDLSPRGDLEEQQVAEVVQQVTEETAEVLAAPGKAVEESQARSGLARRGWRCVSSSSCARAARPNIESTSVSTMVVAAEADELVERSHSASRMPPSAPRAMACKRRVVDRHALLPRDPGEVLHDERRRNPPQVKALAAARGW
jgi:hypothetical protein